MVFVGTHLHWNPQKDFVKYCQAANTLQHLVKSFGASMPTVFAGDFNTEPCNNLFNLMSGQPFDKTLIPKQVKERHHELYGIEKVLTDLSTFPKFTSAYANYENGGHPKFSSYKYDSVKMIDHIFVTEHFKVCSLLQMPVSGLRPALPNSNFPSDHLRIEAVIEFN